MDRDTDDARCRIKKLDKETRKDEKKEKGGEQTKKRGGREATTKAKSTIAKENTQEMRWRDGVGDASV